MLLHPKEPDGRPALGSYTAEARRRSVEACFGSVAAGAAFRDQMVALCGDVAELHRIVAELPESDDRLAAKVAAVENTLSAICRVAGEAGT
jgi:hypothetical protein